MRLREKRLLFVAAPALVVALFCWWKLADLSAGVAVTTGYVGSIPVTVFRGAADKPSPAIVIAHGFAGSQQLMQPFALTLARNGYVAVTFDFAGHGRNPEPLPGGLADMNKSTAALLAELGQVVAFARALSTSDRSVALVGHSMASELVTQFAMKNDDIAATVALSLFGREVSSRSPKNLLVIDGAWEPQVLHDAARRIVALTSEGPVAERVTYGDFAQGTARRFVFAAGSEHIGVIYSRDALTEAVAWMNAVFDRRSSGYIDRRGPWLALLFLSLLVLAFPLAGFLPRISNAPLGAGLGWRRLAAPSVGPAVLTPLLLWKAPTDFLPILLGDYLVAHFALYGALTAAGIWLTQRPTTTAPRVAAPKALLAAAAAAVTAYYALAFGLPLDAYVTSLAPTGLRWPLILAMFCGTAVYFLADEWLTRGQGAGIGGYAFTKVCFLASLAAAIALNPQKLFFLIIVTPVIFVLFLLYGVISVWVYRRTGDPRVAALGAAASLALAIAATFPIVA